MSKEAERPMNTAAWPLASWRQPSILSAMSPGKSGCCFPFKINCERSRLLAEVRYLGLVSIIFLILLTLTRRLETEQLLPELLGSRASFWCILQMASRLPHLNEATGNKLFQLLLGWAADSFSSGKGCFWCFKVSSFTVKS